MDRGRPTKRTLTRVLLDLDTVLWIFSEPPAATLSVRPLPHGRSTAEMPWQRTVNDGVIVSSVRVSLAPGTSYEVRTPALEVKVGDDMIMCISDPQTSGGETNFLDVLSAFAAHYNDACSIITFGGGQLVRSRLPPETRTSFSTVERTACTGPSWCQPSTASKRRARPIRPGAAPPFWNCYRRQRGRPEEARRRRR
jgi:hypothetical protein